MTTLLSRLRSFVASLSSLRRAHVEAHDWRGPELDLGDLYGATMGGA